MNQPKRLIVAYEDGSTKEADFESLNTQLRLELAQLGLCPALDRVGASKHYLLVRWQDGWQEVVGVDTDSAELLRYFVIERIEDRGRLSVEVGADYPELFIVERLPKNVTEAMIVSDDGVRSYGLGSQVERWEGIFEDGGKKEFVKYDKTSDAYPHESSEDPAALAGMVSRLQDELKKKDLDPRALLSMREPPRIAEYKELADKAGIRGARKQEDVYGFIEMLLRRLEGVKA
ncbi:MAG: hypothetical protein V1912_03020 [bacterium]